MNFGDSTERMIAEALDEAGIKYLHESQMRGLGLYPLDFYLCDYKIYIEVKRFHSDRINAQIKHVGNVIVVQGLDAVKAFCELIKKEPNQFL